MEYRRIEDTGMFGIWKENELIGQYFPVSELWKRKVYITIGKEYGQDTQKKYQENNPKRYNKPNLKILIC